MADGVRIKDLEEIQVADEACYIPIDSGDQTYKITVDNYNDSANNTAKGWATQAAQSATSATNKASEAQGYASDASNAATVANNAVSSAQSYANTAAGQASAASESANSASNFATSAEGYSNSARTAAESAATQVDRAQDWAEGDNNYSAKHWALAASQAAGGGVMSFNGRGDHVVSVAGDYNATQISYGTSNVAAKLNALNEDVAGATSDIAELQSDVSTAKGNITDLQSDMSTANENISGLQDDVSGLSDAVENIGEGGEFYGSTLQWKLLNAADDHSNPCVKVRSGGTAGNKNLVFDYVDGNNNSTVTELVSKVGAILPGFLKTGNLINGGTQTTAGVNALDAAYGKTLTDNLNTVSGNLGTTASALTSLSGTVNTLSGAVKRLGGNSSLSTNTNFDNVVSNGEYNWNNAAASTFTHCPIGVGGRLIVEDTMGLNNGQYKRQTVIPYNSSEQYTRTSINGGTTWGAWVCPDKNIQYAELVANTGTAQFDMGTNSVGLIVAARNVSNASSYYIGLVSGITDGAVTISASQNVPLTVTKASASAKKVTVANQLANPLPVMFITNWQMAYD